MRKKVSYHKNRPFRLLAVAALRFVQSYLNDIENSGYISLGAFAFCFNFFVIPLYRADGCSGTVSLIAVVIHAWHQEKET